MSEIKFVNAGPSKTNIVAKPSIRNSDKTVLFATNKDVKDEIGFDRKRAEEETDRYSNPGHQEKSYEMVKVFLAPTQSRSFRLHLYYFCFAAIAYAMWRLVDFRAKKNLGIELDTGTVIEFSEFLSTSKGYLFRSG